MFFAEEVWKAENREQERVTYIMEDGLRDGGMKFNVY